MVPTFDILNFFFWSTVLPKKDEISETICVEFIQSFFFHLQYPAVNLSYVSEHLLPFKFEPPIKR